MNDSLKKPCCEFENRTPRADPDVVGGVPPVEPLVRDGVRHEQRLAVAAAGVVGRHGDGLTVRIQRPRETRHRRGPVVVMPDVVLAAPDELDRRRRHRLRDAHAEVDVVEAERKTPAVAAAEHEIGEMDLVGIDIQRAGRCRAGVERILRARPDLGAVSLDPRRARHRLHRRVGEERHAVVGRHDLSRFLRHLRGGAERCVERREDRRARHVAVAGIVVLGAQRGDRLAGPPVAVGDDGDRVLELHDLLDAGHRLRRSAIDRDQLAALHRCDVDRGMQHAGQREVDAVTDAPVDLWRDIEARLGGAPKRVGVGVLQGRIRRDGIRRRGLRQVAEARALPGWPVRDVRPGRRALRYRDTEPLRRGSYQHLPGRRSGHAHAVAGAADRQRAAGGLGAEPARQAVGAVVDCAPERRRHRITGERAQHVGVRIGVEGGRLP